MRARSVRVSFWLQSTADSDEGNPWVVTWWYRMAEGIDRPLLQDDTTEANPDLLWNTWWNASSAGPGQSSGLRAALPSVVRWYHTEIAARLSIVDGDADFVGSFTPTTPPVGQRAGAQASAPLALVAQKKVADSSKYFGRNYLPCIATDVQYDGQVVNAAKTAVTDALTPLLSNTFLATNYPLTMFSTTGGYRPVTAFGVGSRIGVQRRRLR